MRSQKLFLLGTFSYASKKSNYRCPSVRERKGTVHIHKRVCVCVCAWVYYENATNYSRIKVIINFPQTLF